MWTGGGMAGNWGDDMNWSGVGIPGSGDEAIFTGGGITISNGIPANLATLRINGGTANITLQNGNITVNNLIIGPTAMSRFNIGAGMTLSLAGGGSGIINTNCQMFVSGGIFRILGGATMTFNNNLNVNMLGKVQINDIPTLNGGAFGTIYASSGDTLEYVGTGAYPISREVPTPIAMTSTMNGTIVVNKSAGSVEGVMGTLLVNGSFFLNQGTWNVNGMGTLTLNGAAPTATNNGTINVVNNGQLRIDARILSNNGAINIAGGGTLSVGGMVNMGRVIGTNVVNYQANNSVLQYFGNQVKLTTPQELPALMFGTVNIENNLGVRLGQSTVFNAPLNIGTSSEGRLITSANGMVVNNTCTIFNTMQSQISIEAGGVCRVADGRTLTNNNMSGFGGVRVQQGGTLHLDGSGTVAGGGTAVAYLLGMSRPTLLYTGAGNRQPSLLEIPALPTTLQANLHINKIAGTFFERPAPAQLLTLNGNLSITSGTVRTGRGAFWDVLLTNPLPNTATSGNAGFVQGPLQWSISNGNSYTFPLGDGMAKLPFALLNTNSVVGGTIVIAEAFQANAGGMAGNQLGNVSGSEYWGLNIAAGGAVGRSQIGIYRNGSWTPPSTVGMTVANAATNSQYDFIGGTPFTNGLVSNPVNTLLANQQRYFLAGTPNLPVKSGFGYQLLFSAANQEVVAAARPAYDSVSTFTMEALIMPYWAFGFPPGGGNPCIFSFGSGTNINFSLHLGPGYSQLFIGNGTTTVPLNFVPNLQRYQQYHLAVTYLNGVLTAFIDGRFAGTANISLNPIAGRPLRIGSNGGQASDRWNGAIDEVRFWNTVLPQSVIATWKRRELDNSHPNTANLLGYWRFNEGYPQTATDLSSQGNTAQLLGNPAWIEGSTTAGVIVPPSGTSSGQIFATKVALTPLNYSLLGTNGGSTMASVSLTGAGWFSYTPNISIGQDVQDNVQHRITDQIPVNTTATVVVEFSPVITVQPQFVGFNRPTRFTAPFINGGTTPFLPQWTPTTGLTNPTTLTPTATIATDATYTLQTQDGYGFSGTFAVPVLIHPLTLAYSSFSSTGTVGLPSLINSGNPILLRYGIFRTRTGQRDTVNAGISLNVQPIAGGNAQFSFKYDSTLVNVADVNAPGVVINWLNAPLVGGTTQAIVTLFRTSGTPIQPVSLVITISSNATAPIITSFMPPSGGIGTFVTITGANFVNVNNVRFGGIAAQNFVVVSSTEIRAQVANGATGLVTVSAMAGNGNAPNVFTFVQPPTIANFNPTQGASGATVRIQGTNFVSPVTVRFGGVVATNVEVASPTEIFANVSAGATGNVSVTTPGGTVTSATIFTFFGAPFITSIAPTQGTAGDTITVSGNNFLNVDSVRIGLSKIEGGRGIVLLPILPNTLRILLDTGVVSGNIRIFAEAGQGVSAQSFTYIPPPTIDSIVPRVGGAGTVVTVHGRNFVQVDSLTFNGTRLQNLTVISAERLTVAMPSAPVQLQNSTSAIILASRAGRDTTKTPNLFQYAQTPQISGFQPVAAGVGAWITVTGANFVAVQNLRFNGANATLLNGDSVTVLSPSMLRVKVPQNAATGNLSIQAAGGSTTSQNEFRVVQPPSITSFSPTSAASGATIEILGNEFVNVVRVRLLPNGIGAQAVTLAITSIPSDVRILATLPTQATTGIVQVETLQGTANSQTPLTVLITLGPPPVITSYTPPAAEVGTQVFISGRNFANLLNVSIGAASIATFTVLSPTLISFTVPENASSGTLRITTPNGTAFSVGTFLVLKPLTGDNISPLQRDSSILVRFYQASGGGWLREENWLTSRPISSWAGVSVDSGRVVGLRLANNNIQGGLPAYLSELSALRILDLSRNFIEGTVPSSIATMRLLRELRLADNRLSGALPVLSSMASLEVLSLENNRLVGEFPSGLCALSRLSDINLQNNAFSGTLPACIGALSSLVRCNLSENLFSGTLPEQVTTLPALQELRLQGNMFTGALPNFRGSTSAIASHAAKDARRELHTTPQLTVLDVRRNQFSGAIPTSIVSLSLLRELNVAQNRLTGTLPATIGNCSELEVLNASNNQLSGTIPSSVGNLQKLRTLNISANRFSGALPQEMGRMLALTTILADSNSLTGVSDSLARCANLRIFTIANNQLSRLPNLQRLDSVNVSRNRLQFANLDAIQQARAFVYAPQDSILQTIDTTIQVFTRFSVQSQLEVGRHDYQWFLLQNGITTQLAGRNGETLTFERFTRLDTGVYTCFVRNNTYPNLTLIRRTVRIAAFPPAAPREIPVLISPSNNAQSIALTTFLRWTTLATVSGYDVQISTTAQFSSILWQTAITNPFIPGINVPNTAQLLNLTNYFWRVRAVSEGLAGQWSDAFRFTTQPANQPLNVETVDMGRVVVGRVSRGAELKLRNLSNVALIVQNIEVQGTQILNFRTNRLQSTDGTLHFRFVNPINPTRLDLDEEMTVPLVFSPNVVGEYRGNVVVTFVPAAGGAASTISFSSALIGRGGILVIDSLNFGTITSGITRTETLRIRNIGLDSVRIQGLSFQQSDTTNRVVFRPVEQLLSGLWVRPNDSLFINVNCAAAPEATARAVRGSVTIFSSLDTVYQVPLLAQIRRPNINDITVATVLVAEQQNIAPGGTVTLFLKISTVASQKARGLLDLYVATASPIFSGEIEFDSNVLVPDVSERGIQKSLAVGGLVRYRIPATRWQPLIGANGEIRDSVLLAIRCRAVSGVTNTTTLKVHRFAWDTSSAISQDAFVVIEKSPDASFTSAACEAGGMRLTTAAKPNQLRVVSKNPTSDDVRIAYTLREDSNVEVRLVDVLGTTLLSHKQQDEKAGDYEIVLHSTGLPSGVYFVQLFTQHRVLTCRVDVVR
jgi:Leucine-rich repeat (LRR) protein